MCSHPPLLGWTIELHGVSSKVITTALVEASFAVAPKMQVLFRARVIKPEQVVRLELKLDDARLPLPGETCLLDLEICGLPVLALYRKRSSSRRSR